MGKLPGKVAVITGGTEGIGLATARLFVNEGAYAFMTGRRQKELDAVGASVAVGGFGQWRNAIDKIQALNPRHIIAGHQNKQLDDDAKRVIAETRQYLDDADELLQTEETAVDFFNAKIERYPNHLGRTVLWAGASVIYGVRERPGEGVAVITVNAWL